MLDLVLAVLVLQPLVLSLNRNAVRWRNRLDYREVIRRIERSTDQVDIWKYWTGLLEPRLERSFVQRRARGAGTRGALSDHADRSVVPGRGGPRPAGGPTDALALMRQNIEQLDAIVRELPARSAELFRVRISATGPAHALYRVDDWLSYGLFRDRRVSENYQREVRVRGDLGGLALEAFDNRWNGAGLQDDRRALPDVPALHGPRRGRRAPAQVRPARRRALGQRQPGRPAARVPPRPRGVRVRRRPATVRPGGGEPRRRTSECRPSMPPSTARTRAPSCSG